ncbi:MAG TPA: 2-oxo-4-hydroxy-4-carboxy-5-ureidoimidazoline decarboxylase [Bryobacteraceae bacterium]|nr:2-oxo-4-hydroxy-4-carboxy-5-ureidoimidazoline decarboxylase [Bryobacteraceae bacterium]
MTLAELNILPRYRAEEEFLKCCGSVAWARAMARRRPFASFERLLQAASEIWWRLDETDWKEAFSSHPQIGQRIPAAHASAQSHSWSAQEQSGAARASSGVASALEEANREYLAKFGYIFIVCASGKGAEQMLAILQERLANPPQREIRIAAEEQDQITRVRLKKLFPL